MLETKFPPWPSFTEEEADAVSEVLLSNKVNYWTGKEGRAFEDEFAHFCGTSYAIALANGTVALELALKAIDVGPGDEVVVTSRTFIASVSCIVAVGAIPVFADVDPLSQNITVETISAVLSPQTRAIICVHLAGWPCEMEGIVDLAHQNGLFVIEDCAQAHGAVYKGRRVGSFGDFGAFSFCQDKIMTTGGEGGMLTVNNESLWKKAWAYKDHGKSWDTVYKKQHPPGFRWLHESFGTNLRLTEMQAAIGRIQLKKLPGWLNKRQTYADTLNLAFQAIDCVTIPQTPDYIKHAYYKYYLLLDLNKLSKGWDRDKIMSEIYRKGVPCYTGTCSEVYLEKAFSKEGFIQQKTLPVAHSLTDCSLVLLVHPTMEERHIDMTIAIVTDALNKAVS